MRTSQVGALSFHSTIHQQHTISTHTTRICSNICGEQVLPLNPSPFFSLKQINICRNCQLYISDKLTIEQKNKSTNLSYGFNPICAANYICMYVCTVCMFDHVSIFLTQTFSHCQTQSTSHKDRNTRTHTKTHSKVIRLRGRLIITGNLSFNKAPWRNKDS